MSSCIGCGYCCETAICVAGQRAYHVGPQARCPALVKRGETYRCLLADAYHDELAIGAGCCSGLNSRRRELIERMKRELL